MELFMKKWHSICKFGFFLLCLLFLPACGGVIIIVTPTLSSTLRITNVQTEDIGSSPNEVTPTPTEIRTSTSIANEAPPNSPTLRPTFTEIDPLAPANLPTPVPTAAKPMTDAPMLTRTLTATKTSNETAIVTDVPLTYTHSPTSTPCPYPVVDVNIFYVYRDFGDPANKFFPAMKTGDTEDIAFTEPAYDESEPCSTYIRIVYTVLGRGSQCEYGPPCDFAGIIFIQPNIVDIIGEVPGVGFDLRDYRKITFRARADRELLVDFKLGGVAPEEAYGDSLQYGFPINPTQNPRTVTTDWQTLEIDLSPVTSELDYIVGGFSVTISAPRNGIRSQSGVVLVLEIDDIKYEK
jgi:hypothetical protein